MEPALPMFIPAKSKKKKKEKKDKGDVLSRIKLENFVQDPSAPATFAPLDDYLAPKEKGGDEENGKPLQKNTERFMLSYRRKPAYDRWAGGLVRVGPSGGLQQSGY